MQIKKYLLFLMVLGLFLSEITLQLNPILGFLLYAILICGVITSLSHSDTLTSNTKIIISFMILPMIRIVELFLTFDIFWRTFITYFALAFLTVFYTIKFESDVGFSRRKTSWLPITILLGIALGIIGSLILNPEKNRELFYLLPLIAFSEEILFRGLIQKEIKKIYNSLDGILVSSLLCFIFTLSYGLPLALFFLAASLISAFFYNKTSNIWLSISINLFANIFLFAM